MKKMWSQVKVWSGWVKEDCRGDEGFPCQVQNLFHAIGFTGGVIQETMLITPIEEIKSALKK